METRTLLRIGQISGGIFFDLLVFVIAFGATFAVAPHRWLQLAIWAWSLPPLFVGFGAGAALGEAAAAKIEEWRENFRLFKRAEIAAAATHTSS